VTSSHSAELLDLRKRNKTLETENEIHPLVRDLASDGVPVAVTC
jgi:hypothetical protein